MQIVNGYRTKSGSMKRMSMIADKLSERIHEIWRKQYLQLLTDEITYTTDAIVLGTEKYDERLTILQVAEDKVCNAIHAANINGTETSLNLVVILEYMYMPDGYVYINVASPNWFIADGIFDDVQEVEKYDVTAVEAEQATGHIDMWNKIAKTYSNGKMSFRQNYIPELPLMKVGKDDITFKKPSERAVFQAMSRERNNILAALTGGQQIMPQILMRKMDEVEIEMQMPVHQQRIQDYINQLSAILPEITYEMIANPIGANKGCEQKPDIVEVLEEKALNDCAVVEDEKPSDDTGNVNSNENTDSK